MITGQKVMSSNSSEARMLLVPKIPHYNEGPAQFSLSVEKITVAFATIFEIIDNEYVIRQEIYMMISEESWYPIQTYKEIILQINGVNEYSQFEY